MQRDNISTNQKQAVQLLLAYRRLSVPPAWMVLCIVPPRIPHCRCPSTRSTLYSLILSRALFCEQIVDLQGDYSAQLLALTFKQHLRGQKVPSTPLGYA